MPNLYKLTIPNTEISNDLSDFPVLLNFDTTSGSTDIDSTDLFNHFAFPESVDDDFTGEDNTQPDSKLWMDVDFELDIGGVTNTIADIEILNNELKMDIITDISNGYIRSKYKVSGDFDVQVNFNIPNGIPVLSDSWEFGLRFITDKHDPLLFPIENFTMARYGGSNGPYLFTGTDITNITGGSNDLSGKLRLTRTGSVITGYYWNGTTWVGFGSGISSALSIGYFQLDIRTWSIDHSIKVEYDNFILNSGNIEWDAEDLPEDLNLLKVESHTKHNKVVMGLNPYAYWRLGEITGTTAYDLSGNNYNGAIDAGVVINQSGLLVNDVNKSMRFTGDGIDFIDIGSDELNQVSISCLVKFEDLTSNQIIFKEGGNGNGFGVGIVDSKLSIGVTSNSSNTNWGYATSNLSLNQIYHIVWILDVTNSKIQIYLDGVLIVDETAVIGTHDGTCNCAIGTSNCYTGSFQSALSGLGNDEPFIGTIDEVAIFNQTLNIAEVNELYNSTLDNIIESCSIEIDRWDHNNNQAQLWVKVPYVYSNDDTLLTLSKMEHNYSIYVKSLKPVAYWRLGESTGSTAFDEMGSYNGTYINLPTLNQSGLLVDDGDACVYLDGVDQIISAPFIFSGDMDSTDLTYTCLVNLPAFNTYGAFSNQGLYNYEYTVDATGHVVVWYQDATIITSTNTLTLNETYFLTLTKDGTSHTLYIYDINGLVESVNVTSSKSFTWDETNFFIGSNGSSNYANVKIDEVAIFDYVLSLPEITEIYNQSIAIIQNHDIGITGESPAQDVWTEYTAVYHLSSDGADSTANALDGSMINMDSSNIIDGGIGKALSFDGTTEYINIPHNALFDSVDGYLIETTYKPLTTWNPANQDYITIISKNAVWGTAGFSQNLYLRNTSNDVRLEHYMRDGGRLVNILGTGIVDYTADFKSHSFVCTALTAIDSYTDSSIDTQDVQTLVTSYNMGSDDVHIGLGYSADPNDVGFNGIIQEVRIGTSSKPVEWITANDQSIKDTLIIYENTQFRTISGTITESFDVVNWLARAWLMSDGSLSAEEITSSGTFDLTIPFERSDTHMVTVSPIIGDSWIESNITLLDDLVFPTNPTTIPYYYKCIIAGITGTSEPTWTVGNGDQITDSGVTWELVEGMIQPITQFPVIPS